MEQRINIRVPEELAGKIDEYVERLQADMPAVAWTRSSALRKLIYDTLELEKEGECIAAKSANS
jgi:hypothetical protein